MSEPHLSPQAYERLREELEERSTTRRREISLQIERAREHGDISENADYDAAKNEQGHNEARIRQLEEMLKNAVVLDAVAGGEVVEPGVLVELQHDGDDDAVTYLVGSIEERHCPDHNGSDGQDNANNLCGRKVAFGRAKFLGDIDSWTRPKVHARVGFRLGTCIGSQVRVRTGRSGGRQSVCVFRHGSLVAIDSISFTCGSFNWEDWVGRKK